MSNLWRKKKVNMDEGFRRRENVELKEPSHANGAIKIQAHQHAVSITPRRIVIDYGPPQSPPNDWWVLRQCSVSGEGMALVVCLWYLTCNMSGDQVCE